MFQLPAKESGNWRSHLVMSKNGRKNGVSPCTLCVHRTRCALTLPVLNSPRAVEVSLYAMRAFVRPRETLAAHKLAFRALAAPSHLPQCQLAGHPSR